MRNAWWDWAGLGLCNWLIGRRGCPACTLPDGWACLHPAWWVSGWPVTGTEPAVTVSISNDRPHPAAYTLTSDKIISYSSIPYFFLGYRRYGFSFVQVFTSNGNTPGNRFKSHLRQGPGPDVCWAKRAARPYSSYSPQSLRSGLRASNNISFLNQHNLYHTSFGP